MRPPNGMVSLKTDGNSEGCPLCLIAFIPLSDKDKLMDFVKFRGTVKGPAGLLDISVMKETNEIY